MDYPREEKGGNCAPDAGAAVSLTEEKNEHWPPVTHRGGREKIFSGAGGNQGRGRQRFS